MSRVHDDLDAILAMLERQGFSPDANLGPGLDEARVRSTFEEIGVDPPDDLIDLFTWHTVIAQAGFVSLVRAVFLWPLDQMVATYRANRAIGLEPVAEAGNPRDVWPGPVDWFPALATDATMVVAVNCGQVDRGSVWFAFTQDSNVRMYDSFGDAIAGARRCLEAGYWHYDSQMAMVKGDAMSPAWLSDRLASPWRITV